MSANPTHLEGVEEVVEAPGNDDIVVKPHAEGDERRGNPYASPPGADLVPHP